MDTQADLGLYFCMFHKGQNQNFTGDMSSDIPLPGKKYLLI